MTTLTKIFRGCHSKKLAKLAKILLDTHFKLSLQYVPSKPILSFCEKIMNKQQIALYLTLDALGIRKQVKTFPNRLAIQKGIYLAQEFGINLGYFFRWYLHGPYSPSLSRDAYEVVDTIDEIKQEPRNYSLDSISLDKLTKLKQSIKSTDPKKIARELELLGSVRYLHTRFNMSDKSVAEVTKGLIHRGKSFTEKEVKLATEKLSKLGL